MTASISNVVTNDSISGPRTTTSLIERPSPFDLLMTELDFVLHWSQPFTKHYPAMPLARLLRARLWRSICRNGNGAQACASRAERARESPACARMGACLAHAAFPLPGQARSHHAAAMSLSSEAREPTQTLLSVRLLGNAGKALCKPVTEALSDIVKEGLKSGSQSITGIAVNTGARAAPLADRVNQLARTNMWRIRLMTPWVISKAGRQKDFRVDLVRFVQQLPVTIAQRAYKLAALDLTERRAIGERAPDGDAAHELCLRARDAAAADLAQLEVDAVHVSRLVWHDRSASNAQSFALHCVMGDLRVSVPDTEFAPRCASWLAMLEIFGGGEMTAVGFGTVRVEPVTAKQELPEEHHE